MAQENQTLRQLGAVTLGAAAAVRGLVAMGTLGLSEGLVWAAGKGVERFGTRPAPPEGIKVTVPAPTAGNLRAEGAEALAVVSLRATALPARIPSGMTNEAFQRQVQEKIDAGQRLCDRLAAGVPDGVACTTADMTNLMFFLQAKAEAKGQGFSSGAFSIEDPGQNIRRFLDTHPAAYQRESAELGKFQAVTGGRHRGIDCHGGDFSEVLPNGMRSLLYGAMSAGDGSGGLPVDRLFLRGESHGAYLTRAEGGGDSSGPRRFGNLHDIGALVGHTFSAVADRLQGASAGFRDARVPDHLQNGYQRLLENMPDKVRAELAKDNPLGREAGIRVMHANVERAILAAGQGPNRQDLENFREALSTGGKGQPPRSHLDLRIGDEVILQSADLLTDGALMGELDSINLRAQELAGGAEGTPIGAGQQAILGKIDRFKELMGLTFQRDSFSVRVQQDETLEALSHHVEGNRDTKDEIRALVKEINGDVDRLAAAVLGPASEGQAPRALAMCRDELVSLQRAIEADKSGLIETATRAGVSRALQLVDTLAAFAPRVEALAQRKINAATVDAATLPDALRLAADLATVGRELADFAPAGYGALEQHQRVQGAKIAELGANYSTTINTDLGTVVAAIVQAGSGRAPYLSDMESKIAEISALNTAVQQDTDGVVTTVTRQKIDEGLAGLIAKRDDLVASARETAGEARRVIDEAEAFLHEGGGLTSLTFSELSLAAGVLGRLDRLIASPNPGIAPHLQALRTCRTDLAKRIDDAVRPHLSNPDSLSAAVVLGKLEHLHRLGFPSAKAALAALPLPSIVATFLSGAGAAVLASGTRGADRIAANANLVGEAVRDRDVRDGAHAIRSIGDDVGSAMNLVSDVGALGTVVQAAFTTGKFSAAGEAIDAFLLKSDPELRADLKVLTDQMLASLGAAIESLPEDLSAEAQNAVLLNRYDGLARLEQALPESTVPADVLALRREVTVARGDAKLAAHGLIAARQESALASAVGEPDPAKRAARLISILAGAVDSPATGERFAGSVRQEIRATLDEQRTTVASRLAAGGGAFTRAERPAVNAERAAVTAQLRQFARLVEDFAAISPSADVSALRSEVSALQLRDARNQLGPLARAAVASRQPMPGEPEGRMDHALLQLYRVGALAVPSFVDALEIKADDARSAVLLCDLAEGDAKVINGNLNGPEWDQLALSLKKLKAGPEPQTNVLERIELEHALFVARRALDFALRAGNPDWSAAERAQQLQRNASGANAGGMTNLVFNTTTVVAFLTARDALLPEAQSAGDGAAANRSAAQAANRTALDVESFNLALCRVIHLEGRAEGRPDGEIAVLIRLVLNLEESVLDEDVLAKTTVAGSFSSAAAMLKMADALGEFSNRIVGSKNANLLAAMAQFRREAGDGRADAALLVDRISAQTLVRSQQAGNRLERRPNAEASAETVLTPGQRIYADGWVTTTTRLTADALGRLGASANLVESLVTHTNVNGRFLDAIGDRLARKTQLDGGGTANRTGIFGTYFGISSRAQGNNQRIDVTKVNLEAIRSLRAYSNQELTIGGRRESLASHIEKLIELSTGYDEEFAVLARQLIAGLPRVGIFGALLKTDQDRFKKLINDLVAAKGDSVGEGDVRGAGERLRALLELGTKAPLIERYKTEQEARVAKGMTLRFPPPTNDQEQTKSWQKFALHEMTAIQSAAPDLMRIATAVMLEQFSESSYTDFEHFRNALIGGEGTDPDVTERLGADLSRRLEIIGLRNVSSQVVGVLSGSNAEAPSQVLSLLRLGLFAYQTGSEFQAAIAKGLPAATELSDNAEGQLKTHLESYTQQATVLTNAVKFLQPGQTLEVEMTSSGSLRIKAPVLAPGVNATAGFAASRSNSVRITREGDSFVVVCKSGTTGEVSTGLSALGGRVSAGLKAGAGGASGTVLEFDRRAPGTIPDLGDPAFRVGLLLNDLFSRAGGRNPAETLRVCAPDRVRALDHLGAYVGVEANVQANAQLPGDLDAVSLQIEVNGELQAGGSVTHESNSFQHRKTTETQLTAAASVSLGASIGDSSVGVSAGAGLTVTQRKTLVSELGVVSTDSYVSREVEIQISVNGQRSDGDFDRMLNELGISADLRTQFLGKLNLMKRHNPPPTSITLRSNLTQRAAAEIAAARQRGESAGTLINSSASYEISALEFTVPGQQSVVSDGVVRTADQDTLRNAQERIDTAAGNVEQGHSGLTQAVADLSNPGQLRQGAADFAASQVSAAEVAVAARTGALDLSAGDVDTLARHAATQLASANPNTAHAAAQAGERVAAVAERLAPAAAQVLTRAAQSGVAEFAGEVLSSASELLSEAQGALEILGSFSVSLKTESTGAMRASRVFTLKLS
jgi:hypothetical protein